MGRQERLQRMALYRVVGHGLNHVVFCVQKYRFYPKSPKYLYEK
jgi:hypothetical protein